MTWKTALISIFFWLGIAVIIGQTMYSVTWLTRCSTGSGSFWEVYQVVLNGC